MAIVVKVVVVACVAILTALLLVWYGLLGPNLSKRYQERDVNWNVSGTCSSSRGEPVPGARIVAAFREPIAPKHHGRNPPPLRTTSVSVVTDAQGIFHLSG